MPRRTLWVLLGSIVVCLACYERADRNPYGRWLAEAISTIDRHYVEPITDETLFQGAMEGVVSKLDDYSAFFPRNETREFKESLVGQYGGIGIEVAHEGPDDRLIVASPLVGTPAYKAGVRAGDEIVTINGHSIYKQPMHDVLRLLRGEPGSTVVLGVKRDDESRLEFSLVRAIIKTDTVLGDVRQTDGKWNFMLPGEDRIGYVRIVSFGESTQRELEAALKSLQDRKCRGAILDLRNNPGGLLQSSEQICDLFIPKDTLIVSTRGRDGLERQSFRASGKGPYQKLPLVVLVNQRSASASEIVAACLQDHGRAAIVGTRTWGKGTVQNVIPMEGGKSSLKLTVGTYWRPSGNNIHRMGSSTPQDEWGVTPDAGCEVKLDDQQMANWAEKRRQRDALPGALRPVAGHKQRAAVPAADEAMPSDVPASAPVTRAETSPMDFDPQLQRAIKVLQERIRDRASSSPA